MSDQVIADVPAHLNQIHPASSGNTNLVSYAATDEDATSQHTDGQIDEGYQTNYERRESQKNGHAHGATGASRSSPQTVTANSDRGLEILGRGVKELVQAVQGLRHLGIEDLATPLPKIVVVGDQSTGKSSLIEGMSEIKVPRNAGTCTRCPLEINLTESANIEDAWKCTISLYKKYIYEGLQGKSTNGRTPGKNAAAKVEAATRLRPLGPWTLQDGEDFHFATITSKADVPRALHLAQLATLNPSTSYERYMPLNHATENGNTSDNHQVKFSPNVIRLDISGPGLPNLSFYDLPGVINQSEIAEEEYLVTLVRNLVKSYIKDDNCINLLTIPMSDDPANSSASRLIREVKAEARTVGVLTKPDRIQHEESLEQWTQILSGKKFRLGFGYHVVKNNPDPDVDHATARAEERMFFDKEKPWSTALNTYSDRFGTLKLQTALSHRLTAQIRASLPRITDQVQRKADLVDEKLQLLPEQPAGNLPMKILEKILEFENSIKKHIDGGSPEYPFPKDWKNLAMQFREIMAEACPKVIVCGPYQKPDPRSARQGSLATDGPPGTPTPTGRPPPAIVIDSDDEEDQKISCHPTPASDRSGRKRSRASIAQITPQKRCRIGDIPPFKAENGFAKKFYLEEIRGIIQDARIGLPGQVDPKATDWMIKDSMQHWEKPLRDFLARTEELCQGMIFKCINEAFGHWTQTPFHEEILRLCESFTKEAMSSQADIAMRVLSWELERPLTFDDEAMRLANEKALADVQQKRRDALAGAYLDQQERTGKRNDQSNKASTGQSRTEKVAKVTDAQIGPDPFSQEVAAMGTVKGYYQCAFSEFVNVICKGINSELFRKCRNELAVRMKEQFRLTDPGADEKCALLLEVDTENQEKRLQLKKEKGLLRTAQDWLEGLTENMMDHHDAS